MRLVVGTNVFVGALLSQRGNNREVLRACLIGKAIPLFGTALFNEYEDLLGRSDLFAKSILVEDERQAMLDSFIGVSEWVKIYCRWRPNLSDQADNHLMELAVAGGAEAIVTDNFRDFNSGELGFPSIRILNPKQFLEQISWPL
ncbi:putative toxin-antitoxin system toxin component, PIN family [Phragmitibacter flavus]|uniref:Putative toxin-antitoxin system toxin component, PIN family n=1 Tax=Phragmitibacter flavus TaxID=2576071 RepID=A0A5R8KJD6_9BACT|nr:putative toxin-antitoxin system toxin component, PIN family [Phragmitibacter flavus]TLD72433.1 putative toxin-antitoxin system toxin component, PIN family [Phragmitibacter flavus]